jgi:hypothetical protein
MSVWVKCRDVDQDAFEVSLEVVKNISQLKEAIIGKRKKLLLPDAAVLHIYLTNIGEEEAQKLKPGAKVPIPADGQIGSSDDLPYFFSIAQTPPGNLFLFEFHGSSCWCSSMSLNFIGVSCCELFGVLI